MTTPDQAASRLAMQGVLWPVNLHFSESQGAVFHEPIDTCSAFECREGRWFPEAVASALVALEHQVAEEIAYTTGRAHSYLAEALDRLDQARTGTRAEEAS